MGFGTICVCFAVIIHSTAESTCDQIRTVDTLGEFLTSDNIVPEDGLWNSSHTDDNGAQGNDSMIGACNWSNHSADGVLHVENTSGTVPPWRVTFGRVNFVVSGIYFPVVTALALIGNSLTVSVLRKDVLHSSSTTYLLGLATADLLFVICFAPNILRAYSSIATTRAFETFNAFYGSYFFPFVYLFHTAAVWVTVAFTVERFVAIAMPMKAQKYCTKSRAQKFVVGAFVFGLALNTYRFFRRSVIPLTDPVTNETYYTHKLAGIGLNEHLQQVYFWVYFIATKAIPFPLLVSLNSAIIGFIWRAKWNRLILKQVQSDSRENTGNSHENQITRILVLIVMAFIVCNSAAGGASLYIALYGVKGYFGSQDPAVHYLFIIGEALINTNPLVNCALYAACSQTMRKELLQLLCPNRTFKPALKASSVTQETDPDGE